MACIGRYYFWYVLHVLVCIGMYSRVMFTSIIYMYWLVLACVEKWYVLYILVRICTYWYQLIYIDLNWMYWYVLVCMVCTGLYFYVLVSNDVLYVLVGIYLYVSVLAGYVFDSTDLYW